MKIEESLAGNVVVLKPHGPLARADAEQFKERLVGARREGRPLIVIDASGIPFVDSLGLQALVETTEEMVHAGGARLKLAGANETFREVMDLTEIAPLFEHFIDVESALRSS